MIFRCNGKQQSLSKAVISTERRSNISITPYIEKYFVKTDVIARSRRRRGNLVWRLPRSLGLPRNDVIHTDLLRTYRFTRFARASATWTFAKSQRVEVSQCNFSKTPYTQYIFSSRRLGKGAIATCPTDALLVGHVVPPLPNLQLHGIIEKLQVSSKIY